jgi:uncharacterized membrane protein
MIRAILESLMKSWGEHTTRAPLTRYERALIHALYLGPLATATYIAARLTLSDTPPRAQLGKIATLPLGLAAVTIVFLFWAASYRKAGLETWSMSHLFWISKAYISLAAWSIGGVLLLAIFMVIAAIISPKLAAAVIYGIPLVAIGVAGTFLFRIVSGYLLFLKEKPIGRKWRSRQESNLQPPA